jgi:hypothetical protein
MISLFLEKKRKKAQNTLLGVEFDTMSLAAVQLNKNADKFSLVSCDSEGFSEDAYFEGELTSDYVGNVISNIISENKLPRSTKLGLITHKDIDVLQEDVICDKKALEIIDKEGIEFYIRESFFKKKYPDKFADIAFDYFDDIEKKGSISIYYIAEQKVIEGFNNVASSSKKVLSVCALDRDCIVMFVKKFFLSELAKNKRDCVFLGLYSDKLSIYSFTNKGRLKNHESIRIFDEKIADASYIDETVQLLLRFMDFMSLDFSEEDDFENFAEQDNAVYIYGIKQNLDTLFESIKELSMKDCRLLNPFINIDCEAFGTDIEKPYRYVTAIGIAMRESL